MSCLRVETIPHRFFHCKISQTFSETSRVTLFWPYQYCFFLNLKYSLSYDRNPVDGAFETWFTLLFYTQNSLVTNINLPSQQISPSLLERNSFLKSLKMNHNKEIIKLRHYETFFSRNLNLNVLLSVSLFCVSLCTYYLSFILISPVFWWSLLLWPADLMELSFNILCCLAVPVQCIPVCSISYCCNEQTNK